jgi:hypothetical protein
MGRMTCAGCATCASRADFFLPPRPFLPDLPAVSSVRGWYS